MILLAPTRRSGSARVCIAAAVIAACALAAPAPAQSGGKKKEELRPPVPPQTTSSSPPTIPLLVGIALAAMVAGVAFIPSKRGHQD
ncbi:MAG: hypothetical protein IT438_03065 [Phycisphaerales bacterium]|nr:hypothetical protein [Phycisphaerales bacterium]